MSLRQLERNLHTSARYPEGLLFFQSKPSRVWSHTQRIERPRISVHFKDDQTQTYESVTPKCLYGKNLICPIHRTRGTISSDRVGDGCHRVLGGRCGSDIAWMTSPIVGRRLRSNQPYPRGGP